MYTIQARDASGAWFKLRTVYATREAAERAVAALDWAVEAIIDEVLPC